MTSFKLNYIKQDQSYFEKQIGYTYLGFIKHKFGPALYGGILID